MYAMHGLFSLINIYFAPQKGENIGMSMPVSLSTHISQKPHTQTSPNFLMLVAYGLGSVLFCL